MLKYTKLTALVLLGAIVSSTAYAQTKPAATVNGVAIPQARLEMRIKAALAQGQPDTPELRNAALEDLITLEVLAQAATKKGFHKQSEVVQQIELTKQNILASAFFQDYVKKHPLSDSALKQEYDRITLLRGNKEYKVSHILLKTEADAKAVVDQLKNSKFEDVAMDKSQDPGSSVKGGDLGWAVPSSFVKPFSDAMVALNKGQTSEPVQSQYGWHVIKLEDTRDVKVPTFDEVKPNLNQHLQQQMVQKAIAEQRSKAVIK
ncbi:MAG: peptidylprolyl isomerase [Gallionellaceae bacterium]|jgi:peptidyl-prolyl cis-trans isomerase C